MSEEAQEETQVKRETDQEEWDRKQQEKLAEHDERRARVSSSEDTWLRPPKERTGVDQPETQEQSQSEQEPSSEERDQREVAREARQARQSKS